MRKHILIVAVLSSVVAFGCEEKKAEVTPTPSASVASAAPSASAPQASASAPAPSASVAPSGKMSHCPNAVTGAATVIKDVEGGVELTVTSKDAAAVADIRARAKVLADAARTPALQSKHTGAGGGGGTFGRCPVVMKDTSVDIADVPDGSKITVKAKTADTVDWLRRESRERQTDIVPASTEGAGERKMAHCPSAVEGAATVVKDNKDGVTVTVTGKGDAIEKEIRARAKFLLEAASHDGGAIVHSGSGTGGGGLGRCPIVVKDTTVGSKDVPGGAEFTVKAKKAADVGKLQKEARDRATNFAAQQGAAPGASASAAPSASAPPKK